MSKMVSAEIFSSLEYYQKKLYSHRIYSEINNIDRLKIFMKFHVFSVWDFMTILKALQKKLTCVDLPWYPKKNGEVVRFINEIVLGEESDEVEPGLYLSHFELYLKSCEEVGLDCKKINEEIINYLEFGIFKNLPTGIGNYVLQNLSFAEKEDHILASIFVFGREHIIPSMFENILKTLESSKIESPSFNFYLKRHIELDGEEHGPMSIKLLESLCGSDEKKWDDVYKYGLLAIESREKFWDEILRLFNA